MLRSLMVPLDGSAFAEQALPIALGAARHANADLDLAIVRATLPLEGEREEDYLSRVTKQVTSASPSRITRSVLSNELGPLEYPPPAPGTVGEVLVRHAEELSCDLIVMTTHGRGGIRRAWLGSVTDSLIRIASCPVLVIRPKDEKFTVAAGADRGIRHIVVPLDGSESAERAIAFARFLGEPFCARYTLVRVTSPVAWHGAAAPTGSSVMIDAPALSRDAVQHYLETVAGGLRQFDVPVATQVLDGTSPAAAILEYSRIHAVDMIALTTSGAGGISRLLLGSVADKIVRSGDVPVLVGNVRHMSASGRAVAAAAPAGAVAPT
jgi:nucleotide-binding universal stress UspA family protein